MSNPDLHRYEKELRASVKGFRLRRRLHRSFRQAVMPFLEETAAPSYEELTAAFGPPDQMAQDLLRTMANPPQPLRRGQKVGIVLVACLIVVGIGVGAFSWWNAPEDEVTLSDGSSYTDDVLLPNARAGAACNSGQNEIAVVVPILVVEGLEIVDIRHRRTKDGAIPVRIQTERLQLLV